MLWASHSPLDPQRRTCDQLQYGDPDRECTGIVLTCSPSCDVIKKAHDMGCNFIIGHEPLFYDGWDETDWQADDKVLNAKRKLLDETGMTVIRDHDHMHNENPDEIFSGLIAELGWQEYVLSQDLGAGYIFKLPHTTVRDVAQHVCRVMNISGMRIIGNLDMEVERVAIAAHFLGAEWDKSQLKQLDKYDVQLVIPGEIIDWTIGAYVRDAISMGKNMALLNCGHFNLEEPGMKHMVSRIQKLVGEELAVHYLQSGNIYSWLEKKTN